MNDFEKRKAELGTLRAEQFYLSDSQPCLQVREVSIQMRATAPFTLRHCSSITAIFFTYITIDDYNFRVSNTCFLAFEIRFCFREGPILSMLIFEMHRASIPQRTERRPPVWSEV